LWQRYCAFKGIDDTNQLITQDYYSDGSGKTPRYYQINAINRTIEAIAHGQNRILLVMATGTGKTFTAFQIIWRLWKSRVKKRILFLGDRNILIDQTKTNDFKPFGSAMTKIQQRQADKSYEIYLALYQAVSGTEEVQNIYKQFSPNFFDLIVVDECHRGSAAEDSAWREILEYFSAATQIGLTATPKETKEISNINYFGEPVYTYSLKQGIEDGFLAPSKVVRIDLKKTSVAGNLYRDSEISKVKKSQTAFITKRILTEHWCWNGALN
jgi:type I restriction enzyme R subunit